MSWVACLRGKRASMVDMGDVLASSVSGGLACVAWVEWVVCLCRWHPSVAGMSGVLIWRAFYYFCYFYCYYWNTILKSKMLNVYFWNKILKISQIDSNSDLKEEPNLKDRRLVYTIWTVNERTLNMPESTGICTNVGKYSSIRVTRNVILRICLNIREILRA